MPSPSFRSLFPTGFALACCAVAAHAQAVRDRSRVVKLNEPLARPTVGSILAAGLLGDGSRAVYRADLAVDDVWELWSFATTGSGTALRLNGALASGGVVWDFQIAPGSDRVVYLASQRFSGVNELFSVPADRSRTPARLSGTLTSQGDVLKYAISGDGTRVAYIADQATDGVDELYWTPIDPPVLVAHLNGPLVAGGDVRAVALTADGSRAVYLADQESDEVLELYAVDSSLARVKLSAPLVAGGDVGAGETAAGKAFAIDPTGTRVVYRADQLTNDVPELFSVPIDASQLPVRLNAPLARSVVEFAIDPTGQRVVFAGPQAPAGTAPELFSAPIDGSQPPVKLNAPLGGGSVENSLGARLRISPDGARVVFVVHRATVPSIQELHSAPLDGSAASVRLDQAPFQGFVIDHEIRPDGAGVVFRSWIPGVDGNPVFHVPIDGSAVPLELTAPFPPGADQSWDFAVTPDSQRVVYLGDQVVNGVVELFSAPCDGSAAPLGISGPLVVNGDVDELALSADGSFVLYRADQEVDTVREAFAVAPDGSPAAVKLHPDLPLGPTTGDVNEFELTPDGARVIYAADQEEDERRDVYSVPADASAPPVRLVGFPDGGGWYDASFQLAPDGSRVVVQRRSNAAHELFACAIDGGTSPALVATATYPTYDVDFKFSPDSAWIVYREVTSFGSGPVYLSIFATPADGSAPAVDLTGAWDVVDYAIEPTSHRVVYLEGGIHSVPIDGSAAPVQLTPPGVAFGSYLQFEASLSPDGYSVVYRADQDTPGKDELYRVPIDGSTAPVKISGTLSAPGVFYPVRITADSARAVYFRTSGATSALASARLDATGSPLVLATVGAVSQELQLRGGRAVYVAAPVGSFVGRLFSVPVDGSAAALDVSGPPPGGASIQDVQIATDESRAIYVVQGKAYSVPLDGSQPPVALNASGWSMNHVISDDSRFVLFTANLLNPLVQELFRVAIDGSTAPVRLSDDLVYISHGDHGDVTGFRVAPDGGTAVYRADQEEDDVFELFARHGVGPIRRAPASPGSATRSIP